MAKFVLHCAVRSSLNRNGEKQINLKEQQKERQYDKRLIEKPIPTKTARTTCNLWSYCCCIKCDSSELAPPSFNSSSKRIISKDKNNKKPQRQPVVYESEEGEEEEVTINFWSASINTTTCNCLNCIQDNFKFQSHNIESFLVQKSNNSLRDFSSSTLLSSTLNDQSNCTISSSASPPSSLLCLSLTSSSKLLYNFHDRDLGVLQQKVSPIYNNNYNNNDYHSNKSIISTKYSLRSYQPIYTKNVIEVATTATTATTISNKSVNIINKHSNMNGEERQRQQQQQQQDQHEHDIHGTMISSQNMIMKNVNGATTASASTTTATTTAITTATTTATATATAIATNNNNNNRHLKSNYNNNGFIRNGTIMTTTNSERREHLYKILVIGELGTGKTSFIKRYVHHFFSQNYRATIGVDFALKVLHWDSNTVVRLQLWDIAGQERFGNMTRVYYKEAVGAFIVFDVTRSGTFTCVSKWKEDLDSKVQLPDGTPIPCILLANKCDQEKRGIVANADKMDEYVKEHGFSGWFETSAKENINIDEAARALVNKILLNDKLISASDLNDGEKFNLNSTEYQNVQDDKSKCSC